MAKITVDFNKTIGKIKPLHGIGQPPMVRVNQRVDTTAFRLLKDAGIPYSRLHDVGGAYGNNRFVDIPNIFRDVSKDPYDEKSYHFAFTDILIKDLMENDCEPVFRLGVTIENQSMIEAFNILPPEDFKKWAIVDLEFDCNLPLGEFFITEDELKMSYCPRRTRIQPNATLLIKTK